MTIFANETTVVGDMRANRLTGLGSYFDPTSLSDSYIYDEVLAAEKDAEHRLRCFTEPVIMVPEGTDQSVMDAYTQAGTRWQLEPAYDYDPDFFIENQWGFIQTREAPVISVSRVAFVYPSTYVTEYTFPIEWVKIDKQYGHIRIVPTGNTTTLPLNAWLLQVFSGGRMIPHMLQVGYTAGLADAQTDYPDLVDVIKRMATLRILEDQYRPQSLSDSTDGINQSTSVDTSKFSEIIDKRLERLRQQIHGVRMGFC